MLHTIVKLPSGLWQSVLLFLVQQLLCALAALSAIDAAYAQQARPLTLSWEDNVLRIHGDQIPGGDVEIWYLEAYCRANSHTTDWTEHTVVPHRTQLVDAADDGRRLHLRCRVEDGMVVDHVITAGSDEVDFAITATNPTDKRSEVHWVQPCVRVGKFTGCGPDDTDDAYAYVKKSFIFLDGKLEFMPTADWAMEARYTPGQVWAGPDVPASDVNPRPLNPHRPSNGLIGCTSGDDKWILAIAFEPYQELFQGVARCLHSDFRLGGLMPGETKDIRGKIYIVENDPQALVERFDADF